LIKLDEEILVAIEAEVEDPSELFMLGTFY
jgi:hypothetical protein